MAAITTDAFIQIAFDQDIFDRLDDDGAGDDHRRHLNEWNMMYQFDQVHHRMMAEEEEEPLLDEKEDERVLSQRLSQLSTTSDYGMEPLDDGKRRRVSSLDSNAKKVRIDATHLPDEERIPTYLSIDQLLRLHMDMPMHLSIDDLQRVAFCMHQLNVLPIEGELWTGYLQCGTGLWREQSIPSYPHYWPHHVKSLITTKPGDRNEQGDCVDMVHRHLQEIRQQLARYQHEYDDKQRTRIAMTPTLESLLRELVHEQAVVPMRIKVDMALDVLRCDHEDHWLQFQYQAAMPTDYQKQVAKSLHETTMKLECAKYELVESLQRLLCNRPLASYDYLQIALPPSIVSTARYEQLIQQTKTRLMAVYLAGIEARINQYRIQVREQTHQMWQQHQQHIPDREMPSIFAELMDKRACVMKKKLSVINTFTIAYHVRSAYGRLENIYKGKEPDLYRIGFFSSLVIDRRVDTKARLSHGQRQLLRRGPTYVPPCQLHLSPTLSSVDDRIKKQYAPLQHQIALLFSLYGHDIARHENMKGEIKKEFKAFFSRTVPDAVLHRAIHEKQQIGSIRTMLKSHHWILRRTADHRNTFYLGERKDFEEKCDEYMQNQADQYQLLFTVDAQNRSHIQQKLAKRVQDLNTDLETLHKQKRFGKSVYETLRVNVDKVSLPYLYFLPELSAQNELIGVTPIISAHHSATSKIARYLHRLLRPMMANVLQSRIFRDEADFIQKLIQYSQIEQHLQPNTLFATIRITNPQSIVSHASLVETLGYFMRNNLVSNAIQYTSMRPGIPQYITMSTVTKLTELFLQHNLFYYQGKIYEFKKSGPHSLRLSDDLLNIYLFAWQQSVFGHERLKLELHGRHRHTLFMTWNQSEAELRQFLRSSTERYPSIQLQTTIGRSVQFLNTHIENRQGRLYTRLAHASDTEPYSLPFVVGDAQVEHGRWLQAALTRAGQVCSNVFDFVEERIHLEMACLLAGYSLEFVEVHLRHFFQSSNTETIRFSMHASAYELFRRHSLGIAEQQRTALDKYQALEDKERVLHLHFLRDYGSWNRFHQRFHQIWTNYLHEDADLSNEKTKIILHAKHVYSLNALLAQQKPSIALLNVRPA